MTATPYVRYGDGFDGPAVDAIPVTPNDAADFSTTPARALYVGGAGNVKVDIIRSDGTRNQGVTINALAAGFLLPLFVIRVYATGTTATNLTALM